MQKVIGNQLRYHCTYHGKHRHMKKQMHRPRLERHKLRFISAAALHAAVTGHALCALMTHQ